IVDLTTGQDYDPTEVADPTDGKACSLTGTSCADSWTVHRVRLVIADPTTGMEMLPAGDTRVEFACRQREATTPFELTPGTFLMSLRGFDPCRAAPNDEGVTPAPTVRTIKKAEVVNLDVIEIGVRPLPRGGQVPACSGDMAEPACTR